MQEKWKKATLYIFSRRTEISVSIFFAFLFLCFNFSTTLKGHFHEDAYILFKYVENFFNGHGITYNSSLGPTEGATDFLWLVFLIVLRLIGIDVGIASILLNSIGVFCIVFFLSLLHLNGKAVSRWVAITVVATFLVSSNLLLAAAGGFSVFLYLGLILWACHAYLSPGKVKSFPYIILAISLFRPDGVILALGLWLIYFARLDKSQRLTYLVHTSICVLIGALYFTLRWRYFGYLLPLPLYVKSTASGSLPGLSDNIGWLRHYSSIIIFSISIAILSPYFLSRLIPLSLPFALHFISLFFATQSQNIGARFQGPTLLFFCILLAMGIQALLNLAKDKHTLWKISAGTLIPCVIFLIYPGIKNSGTIRNQLIAHSYINVFPSLLNDSFDRNSSHIKAAISEAGRFAFFSDFQIFDLVGLNYPFLALNNLTVEHLEHLDPDIVFIWYNVGKKQEAVHKISHNELYSINHKKYESLNFDNASKVSIASIVTAEFLSLNKNYFLLSTKYGRRGHNHLYAFKKSKFDEASIIQLMRKAHQYDSAKSYLELVSLAK